MKAAAAAALAAALLTGCAVLPQPSPGRAACGLLDTAMDEGQQFAEAWYQQAGRVLAWCGVPRALERAERGACLARQFNDTSVQCQ